MAKHYYHLFVIVSLIKIVVLNESAPELTISQGTLKGTIRKTFKGRTILAFQGIPYAEPPVGNKRFKAPVPLKSWQGVLDASQAHAFCTQEDLMFRMYGIHGDENCLFLNVYTPKISRTELLPVIVFIHGGGFIVDSGNPDLYGPDILLDKDVVFVTLNYRLGALGFLSTEDHVVPGNNGLKDQSLALHWVKGNIKHFGGDPQKITIFGQSAGGASVYFHLLSPLSKDLIFAGISSSGIALAPWSLAPKGQGIRHAKRLAGFLNCPTTTNVEMVNCLIKADAKDIIKESNNFLEFNYDPGIPFKPIVEHSHKGAFLSQHPADIIRKGGLANVPFMTGITTDDGAMKSAAIYNDSELIHRLNTNFSKIVPMVLNFDHLYVGKDTDHFINAIKHFYFNDKNVDSSTKAAVTDMVTDGIFLYPARSVSSLHAKYSRKPIYFYLFGYRGSSSTSTYFGDPEHDYGVAHCDDLIYLLSSDVVVFHPNELDKKMVDFMTTLWHNFATTGNPTPNVNKLIPALWNPVTSDNFEYYFIKNYDNVTMKNNLYEKRYQFWKNLHIFDENIKVKDEL